MPNSSNGINSDEPAINLENRLIQKKISNPNHENVIPWLVFFIAITIHLSYLYSLISHFKVLAGDHFSITSKLPPQDANSNLMLQPKLKPNTEQTESYKKPKEPVLFNDLRRARNVTFWDRFFFDCMHYEPAHDFFMQYRGGLLMRQGLSLYGSFFRFKYDQAPAQQEDPLPYYNLHYAYPPLVALTIGLTATLISPWHAYTFWVLILEAIILLCLIFTWKLALNQKEALLGISLWLIFSPIYVDLYMGQGNIVMASLIFFIGYGFLRKKYIVSDSAWGISVLFKLLTVILTPLLLRMKRYKTIIIVALLTLFFFCLEYYRYPEETIRYLKLMNSYKVQNYQGLFSVQEFLFHLIGQPFSHYISTVIKFALLSSACALTILTKPFNPLENLSLWMSSYILSYTHPWEHHFVMVLPILLLLFLTDPTFKKLWWWLAFILALPTPYLLFSGNWNQVTTLIYHGWKLIPVALLWFILLKRHLQRCSLVKIK